MQNYGLTKPPTFELTTKPAVVELTHENFKKELTNHKEEILHKVEQIYANSTVAFSRLQELKQQECNTKMECMTKNTQQDLKDCKHEVSEILKKFETFREEFKNELTELKNTTQQLKKQPSYHTFKQCPLTIFIIALFIAMFVCHIVQ